MNPQVAEAIAHPVVGAVTAAFDGLGAVRDAAFFGLADDELEAAIEGCHGVRARAFDTELALVAEADGRDLGRRLGAASTAAWLRDRFRLRPGDARRLVDLANRTRVDDGPVDYAANVCASLSGRELSATAAALGEGVISPEHLAVVAKVMSNLPKHVPVEKAQEVEGDLAGFCRQFDPLTVARLGDCMLHMLEDETLDDREDETLDDREDERHRKRELWLDETIGRISGQLTAEGLALLRTALDPLAAPAPATDGEHDLRSAGQRLADALVELARRAIATDSFEANHGISRRVMVMVGLDTLTAGHYCLQTNHDVDGGRGDTCGDEPHRGDPSGATTANGDRTVKGDGAANGDGAAAGEVAATLGEAARDASQRRTGAGSSSSATCPIAERAAGRAGIGVAPGELIWGGLISTAAVRRISCCAGIQRVVLDPSGAVLDVGREYRTATPAQFAALIARDGGCAFPGCTRPASWCIAHHITHWADGGGTNLDNLVLLCTWHHTVVHHHGWDVRLGADRLPDFYPPPWVDPDREPRRNTRPRHWSTVIVPDR
ncbi:MAG TPA: DUF222 domain-containing protein [Jiangellales bacterium]|nr:DUF222 domain-containing protein [Jiangellales bacterium]